MAWLTVMELSKRVYDQLTSEQRRCARMIFFQKEGKFKMRWKARRKRQSLADLHPQYWHAFSYVRGKLVLFRSRERLGFDEDMKRFPGDQRHVREAVQLVKRAIADETPIHCSKPVAPKRVERRYSFLAHYASHN